LTQQRRQASVAAEAKYVPREISKSSQTLGGKQRYARGSREEVAGTIGAAEKL